MGGIAKVLGSGVVGLIGLGALFVASNANDGGIYYAGLLIFVLAASYIFWQIKRHMDELDRRRHEHGHE
jgi:hypothetical protein